MKRFSLLIAFLIIIISIAISGCTTVVYCEPPNSVIGDTCCLDKNSNKVCDGLEKTTVTKPVENKTSVETNKTTETVVKTETSKPAEKVVAVTTPVVETNKPIELKKGKYPIEEGELNKYLEIKDIDIRRYSRDKGIIDQMTFIVRNIGDKTFSPTVVFVFETGITANSAEGPVEQKYDYYELKAGEKRVEIRPMGVRFRQINKTKTIKMYVYDRYVSPRADKEILTYSFNPWNEMDSTEINQWGDNKGDAYAIKTE